MDNGNGKLAPQVQAPNTVLKLEILFDQTTGAVQVNGPIQNIFVCYGMLELAKDACRKYAADQVADRRIMLPGISVVPRA